MWRNSPADKLLAAATKSALLVDGFVKMDRLSMMADPRSVQINLIARAFIPATVTILKFTIPVVWMANALARRKQEIAATAVNIAKSEAELRAVHPGIPV